MPVPALNSCLQRLIGLPLLFHAFPSHMPSNHFTCAAISSTVQSTLCSSDNSELTITF
jgi:hypothetical protein